MTDRTGGVRPRLKASFRRTDAERMRPHRFALLSALALAVFAGPASAGAAEPWSMAGSLPTARSGDHTATLLQDGRVLLAGGRVFAGATDQTLLYDPDAREWSETGALSSRRTNHTATLLSDGRVLVAGGHDGVFPLASAELYDPATGVWTPTEAMSTFRWGHTATSLADGKVLFAGGRDATSPLASAELYDPATGAWSPSAALAGPRNEHTATRLPGGDVLVAGGTDAGGAIASAERYDAATGAWSPAGTLADPRRVPAATALLDGSILVTGGFDGARALRTVELYDPATGRWSAVASMRVARESHTATTLPDGRVLVTGGDGAGSAELLDPASDLWEDAGRMLSSRYRATATSLRDGSVLVAGGTLLTNTERFRLSATFAATPLHFGDRRSGAAATRAYVLVRNLGSLRFRTAQATLGGADAGDFAIADDGCTGRALAPDTSCRIGVDFAPRADGNRSANLTLTAATGETELVPLSGTGVPAAVPPSGATPARTATASCVRAPRRAHVKLRGARCRFSLVGLTGWTTVKAHLRRGGKVRAAGRVLGWRGRASLTLAARLRLGAGTYTLVLRPAGRSPVRIRISLP